MIKIYGLTGFPLEHSLSKEYFDEIYELNSPPRTSPRKLGTGNGVGQGQGVKYELFPKESVREVLELIIENKDLFGLNVTIPHKINILEILDQLDEDAVKIGAVNCIKIERNGNSVKTKGYNTDWIGFKRSFEKAFGRVEGKALIFGSGGVAKAVGFTLKSMGIPYQVVSKREGQGDLRYSDVTIERCSDIRYIINATPVGMFPDVKDCLPLPYEGITDQHMVFDLVYNPVETELMKRARARGAKVCNGLEMLKIQAEESWRIWGLNF